MGEAPSEASSAVRAAVTGVAGRGDEDVVLEIQSKWVKNRMWIALGVERGQEMLVEACDGLADG